MALLVELVLEHCDISSQHFSFCYESRPNQSLGLVRPKRDRSSGLSLTAGPLMAKGNEYWKVAPLEASSAILMP